MKLFDVAHSRAGDKGNTLMLSLIPFNESDYEMLLDKVTVKKVKSHLQEIVREPGRCRHEAPNGKAGGK